MTRTDFTHAYERGYRSTVHFLLAGGVPPDEVDDIAQAAWTRGWERRIQLREPRNLERWVSRIGLNLFRNRLRSRHAQGLLVEIPCPPPAGAMRIDLERAFGRCRPTDRSLLEAYYLDGYTSDELGRHEHCRAGTVRVRVMRARRRLANALLEHWKPLAPRSVAAAPARAYPGRVEAPRR